MQDLDHPAVPGAHPEANRRGARHRGGQEGAHRRYIQHRAHHMQRAAGEVNFMVDMGRGEKKFLCGKKERKYANK